MKGCRVLNQSEIELLKNNLSTRDRVLMMTGLFFGLRISEMLRLTVDDVSGPTLQVKSAKGSENVTFPIPAQYRDEVAALLGEYAAAGISLNEHTPLFLSQKGGAISREHASRTIKKVCHDLEIKGKVGTHSFRKCFVTRIYESSGRDIVSTKKCSRHKNLSNLDYYIQTTHGTELVEKLEW